MLKFNRNPYRIAINTMYAKFPDYVDIISIPRGSKLVRHEINDLEELRLYFAETNNCIKDNFYIKFFSELEACPDSNYLHGFKRYKNIEMVGTTYTILMGGGPQISIWFKEGSF